MYRHLVLVGLWSLLLGACSSRQGSLTEFSSTPVVQDPLELHKVELYRNGIGYFEKRGSLEGNTLTLKVRKDQINDLLKSLTVLDLSDGKVLRVSLPLDPQTWQNAAQARFTQGASDLASTLQTLRGVRIQVSTRQKNGFALGRIMMVENAQNENQATLTLLEGETMSVIPVAEITQLDIMDGDVVMQLHRNLDASLGEGMFERVDVTIQLNEAPRHELMVSYVVEAPKWKPSYRLVLDSQDSGQALLQAWAVVDNTSGENWNQVQLNLTSGAPIAFRYDLHTPQRVIRPDLTHNRTDRQTDVAIEATSNTAEFMLEGATPEMEADFDAPIGGGGAPQMFKKAMPRALSYDSRVRKAMMDDHSVDVKTKAQQVAGITQFQLQDRLTIPNGSASMVTLIHQKVPGRQLFLFNPDGSGSGYEQNPYRVVRFHNVTPFALEPGPFSIYADGHFVGEGITDAVATQGVSTIPFAVEPAITVEKLSREFQTDDYRLTKIVRGMVYAESFRRCTSQWVVRGHLSSGAYDVLIKHPKAGGHFELKTKHPGLEDGLSDWLIPVHVNAQQDSALLTVIEETPVQREFGFWRIQETLPILQRYLQGNIPPEARKKVQPLLEQYSQLQKLENRDKHLKEQQKQLDDRMDQIRSNLKAIAEDSKAGSLRTRLTQDLKTYIQKSQEISREIIELQDQTLHLKNQLEDLVQNLTLEKL